MVLVVDDFVTMREVVGDLLKRSVYAVLEAENGRTASNVLKSHEVDIVVSDSEMPEMNDLEFLRAVREDGLRKKNPFIFSATAMPEAAT